MADVLLILFRSARACLSKQINGVASYFTTRRLTESQAREAHRRVYHLQEPERYGLDDISARTLGGAAAFQAFLIWDRDHRAVYGHLPTEGNRERLVSMAVAEGGYFVVGILYLLAIADNLSLGRQRTPCMNDLDCTTPTHTTTDTDKHEPTSPSKTAQKQRPQQPNTSLTTITATPQQQGTTITDLRISGCHEKKGDIDDMLQGNTIGEVDRRLLRLIMMMMSEGATTILTIPNDHDTATTHRSTNTTITQTNHHPTTRPTTSTIHTSNDTHRTHLITTQAPQRPRRRTTKSTVQPPLLVVVIVEEA
jgi:hypothetical protein